MLPKSKRLPTKAFKQVIEKGQSFHGPFLIVRTILSNSPTRMSVSVPKKVAKLATGRNLLRRRVYSIISKKEEKIKEGYDVIVILKPGVDKLEFENLNEEIGKIFVKSSLLK